jgi:signal peptidase II
LPGLALVVALVGVAVDQGSKAWAFAPRGPAVEPREVAPGLVAGVLATNEGAVAHLAGDRSMTPMVCGLNGVVTLAAGLWWSCRRGVRWRAGEAAFAGLLAAGILGNSIDRLALGYVRDFLAAAAWPVLIFNLADVFILLGFVLLVGSRAMSRPPARPVVVG